MKTYTRGSAAYERQKFTQRKQREAAMKPVAAAKAGQKYLHPERRDRNGRIKEDVK